MARTRKYRYRRNYYFRRYRQVASRNYFKVKIEYYDKIQFGQNGNPARPIFLGPQVGPDYPSASIITLTRIFQQYQNGTTLANLFTYWRPLGLSVEVMPESDVGKVITNEIPTYVCFRAGSNDAVTLREMKAINQNILLDSRNRQRRYWKLFGMYGDWWNSGAIMSGGISVNAETDGENGSQPSWKIRVNLYVIYKQSKA